MRFIALLAEPSVHFALLFPLVWFSAPRKGARLEITLLTVFFLLVAQSLIAGGLNFTLFEGQQWNWAGKGAYFTAVALIIISGRHVSKAESGWTFRVLPGSVNRVLYTGAGLLLFRLLIKIYIGRWHGFQPETMAFQATLPGLSEEIIYRGLLLELFNHLYPNKVRPSGTWNRPLVWVSFIFALAHGIRFTERMQLQISTQSLCMTFGLGLVMGWLRQQSGSLWPAIVFHNLWNVVVFA